MSDEKIRAKANAVFSWLFPVVYLIHIAEEYFIRGGFYAYISRTRGVNLTSTRFLILSGIGFLLIVAGILISRRLRFQEWMFVCLGVIIIANAITHINTYLKRGDFNPGLATGVLLFLPLGAVSLVWIGRRVSWRKYLLAAAVGLLTNNGAVAQVAARSDQLLRLVFGHA